MRKSNQQSIGQLLEQFVSENKLQQGLSQVELTRVWPDIVGQFIAKHTIELRISKNILFVSLDNAACKEELAYRKSQVLSHVNSISKKINFQEMIIR